MNQEGLAANFRGMSGLSPELIQALEDMQRFIRRKAGIGTNSNEVFVTKSELIESGVAQQGASGSLLPGSTATEAPDYTPPSAPSGLTVVGGYAENLLKFNAASDQRRGYFEVFRSAVNNLSIAVKIAQTTSTIFADSVQNSSTYYYWVRAVSKWSDAVFSPFNATAGTPGSTAPDIDYAMNVLTGLNGAQPFYYLAANETINGILFPAGVYMKKAFIRDAVIRFLQVGEAVIDNANIIALTANKITAGTMSADRIDTNTLIAKEASFTVSQHQTIFGNKAFLNSANINDHLQSDNFNGNPATNSPGTAGWYIGRDGKLYLQDAVIKGTVLSSSFVGGDFSGGNFTGANFFGGLFQGGVFEGNVLRSAGSGLNYATPSGSRVNNVSGYNASWNLAATGTQLAFQIFGKIRMYADGLLEVDEPIISKSNVLASGTVTTSVRWEDFEFGTEKQLVFDTGFNEPSWANPQSWTYGIKIDILSTASSGSHPTNTALFNIRVAGSILRQRTQFITGSTSFPGSEGDRRIKITAAFTHEFIRSPSFFSFISVTSFAWQLVRLS